MDLGLSGKRVVVTGGTRGIGRAIVSAFLREGAFVSFCARTLAEVSNTVSAFDHLGSVHGEALDVLDSEALERWIDQRASEGPGIDAVVCNVSAVAVENTLSNWKLSLESDVLSTVRLIESALPHLRDSTSGSIVLIGSASGREIDFAAGPYSTAKTALVSYAKSLSSRVAKDGIRANVVSPGPTYFEGGFWHRTERENPELFAQTITDSPLGRMATPDDIADAVVFLSSARAGYISGTNLLVEGASTRGIQL